MAGFWKQKELEDGTYDFHDLIAINSVLDVKLENDRRANEASRNNR